MTVLCIYQKQTVQSKFTLLDICVGQTALVALELAMSMVVL